MRRYLSRFVFLSILVLVASALCPQADAQQDLTDAQSSVYSSSLNGTAVSVDPPQSGLPDSPTPQNVPPNSIRQPQTKRILGIIPNFRAVSTDETLPPQSVKDKFVTASEDSFDYSSLIIPGMLAGLGMARKSVPEFHQGGAGYARYYWHSFVDQTTENYMVEFIVPTITHEDTRLYTLGRGGFFKRTGYALSRVVVTRSDSGNHVFNVSEIVGAGASAGLSNLYYPSAERGLGNTGKQWGTDIGIDAATFVFKEFWPDINHRFFHGDKPIQPLPPESPK